MKNNIISLFLMFCISIYSQEKTIPFYDAKITIDGNLDEDIWSKLPENSSFYNYYPNNLSIAKNQTVIKIFHNGKSLFVSAVYQDINNTTRISSLKRDGFYGGGDAFAIIIDPFNKQQLAYYFAANTGNAQTDALIEANANGYRINKNWNAVWKSSVKLIGNKKYYEYEIPLKIVGFDATNSTFGIQFYLRNYKITEWTIFKPVSSEFRLFDLRFTTGFKIENLTKKKINKFNITPSITTNYFKNNLTNKKETNFKPSLDMQYNVSTSLKLDATINPDFSQIEVDRQVTNLTRFSVNFPEKRNFFLENSDLFSNLGVQGVNPFYSRKIGAENNIQFGLKLSGNIAKNTRIGILDVQTKKDTNNNKQNFATLVMQQVISNTFTTTSFFVNKQNTDYFNRVTGVNVNYKSKNNKWSGLANYAKSFTKNSTNNNDFYNFGFWYTTKTINANTSIKKVAKNYITDIGFVPRLTNYDAINNTTIKETFTNLNTDIELSKYPKTSKSIYKYRYFFLKNNTYFNAENEVSQNTTFFNNALYFHNSSSLYLNFHHDYVNLKYGFNPLKNGNYITPNTYNFVASQIGYNSVYNKKINYNIAFRYGNYYNGKRTRYYARLGYKLLPFANLETSYEVNKIDLQSLGKETFHLARFTSEIFLSNKLNWTTYLQYNTQFDNFNINSRVQWEYKPLSYIYLVLTDNFNKEIKQKNWGLSFKLNFRFDL